MGRVTKRVFSNIAVTSAGLELENLIPRGYSRVDGYLRQIIFFQTSGSATQFDSIEVRYFSNDSSQNNLVYKNTSASISSNQYTDSYIDAPFSIDSVNDDGKLILYLQTDVGGVFDIRVDLEITGN